MKKILFAMTATAIVLCATSCSDYFLDLTPTDQQTAVSYTHLTLPTTSRV